MKKRLCSVIIVVLLLGCISLSACGDAVRREGNMAEPGESLFSEREEAKEDGWEKAADMDDKAEEEDRGTGLPADDEGAEACDDALPDWIARLQIVDHKVHPVLWRLGFLARRDIATSREYENPENSVPEDLTEELSTALQNDTLEDYMAEMSAEYVLLQEDEIIQYIREDTSGVLESFCDYIEGGEEWFLFERDRDIIVRQKIDNEEYPYRYYKFPCEDGVYDMALCAYGKTEDYFFISWGDDDYLVVTKRAEGQVNGLAVYHMFDPVFIGWILGLEKTSDGEIEVSYYTYVTNGGASFLDY